MRNSTAAVSADPGGGQKTLYLFSDDLGSVGLRGDYQAPSRVDHRRYDFFRFRRRAGQRLRVDRVLTRSLNCALPSFGYWSTGACREAACGKHVEGLFKSDLPEVIGYRRGGFRCLPQNLFQPIATCHSCPPVTTELRPSASGAEAVIVVRPAELPALALSSQLDFRRAPITGGHREVTVNSLPRM